MRGVHYSWAVVVLAISPAVLAWLLATLADIRYVRRELQREKEQHSVTVEVD
ncbi:MAG: hypothetical protein JOZ57_11585 [Abitibacteriaceae bacterium]|nr:hypothetical protein [Abditibacteriaceae bacterium]